MIEMEFEHDCKECQQLGQFKDTDGTKYDLYFCPQNGHPTVVARYGNYPSDYASGLGFKSKPLKVAEAIAKAEGLL